MSYGLVNRPKSGVTLRVWKIADEITERKGRLARRKEVLNRFAAEGGNPNTASTQYYYWKSARLGDASRTEAGSGLRTFHLAVSEDGTLRLPPEIVEALGVSSGGRLSARLEGGELRLVAPRTALGKARALVRGFDRGEGSPVDELLAERRKDASQ